MPTIMGNVEDLFAAATAAEHIAQDKDLDKDNKYDVAKTMDGHGSVMNDMEGGEHVANITGKGYSDADAQLPFLERRPTNNLQQPTTSYLPTSRHIQQPRNATTATPATRHRTEHTTFPIPNATPNSERGNNFEYDIGNATLPDGYYYYNPRKMSLLLSLGFITSCVLLNLLDQLDLARVRIQKLELDLQDKETKNRAQATKNVKLLGNLKKKEEQLQFPPFQLSTPGCATSKTSKQSVKLSRTSMNTTRSNFFRVTASSLESSDMVTSSQMKRLMLTLQRYSRI